MSRDRLTMTGKVQTREFEPTDDSEGQYLSADEVGAAVGHQAVTGRMAVPQTANEEAKECNQKTPKGCGDSPQKSENDGDEGRGRKGRPQPPIVLMAAAGEANVVKCRHCSNDVPVEQAFCGGCGASMKDSNPLESGSEYSESGQSSYGSGSRCNVRLGNATHPRGPKMRCTKCSFEFRTHMSFCSG